MIPKSKGYQIYWPEKRTISVEQNVVFNQNNIHTSDETSSFKAKHSLRGREIKSFRLPRITGQAWKSEDKDILEQQNLQKEPEPHQNQQLQNTITFPLSENIAVNSEIQEEDQPSAEQYGCGKRARPPPGTFRAMNEGLTSAIEIDNDNESASEQLEDINGYFNCFTEYPPDVALVRHNLPDPKNLDEALQGPNAKEWQEALRYKINQLEKLGIWVIEDLPRGHTPIPWSEVVKVKCRPKGKVQSYQVRIVAGGHRQVEGINYMETFSAAAKMPTVHTVLANAAQQDWVKEHIE